MRALPQIARLGAPFVKIRERLGLFERSPLGTSLICEDMAQKERVKLLIAHPKNHRVYEHPTLELALENGVDFLRPGKRDLIAIPEDWDLMAMQDTTPIGYDAQSGRFVPVETFTVEGETFAPVAVAVHPPPGYVRTHHPAAIYKSTEHPDEKFKKTGGGRLTLFEEPEQSARGGSEGARAGLPLWAAPLTIFVVVHKTSFMNVGRARYPLPPRVPPLV